jgi:hypothetical protein
VADVGSIRGGKPLGRRNSHRQQDDSAGPAIDPPAVPRHRGPAGKEVLDAARQAG